MRSGELTEEGKRKERLIIKRKNRIQKTIQTIIHKKENAIAYSINHRILHLILIIRFEIIYEFA